MDDIDGRQTHVRVEVSAATDDDDRINEDTAPANDSNHNANNHTSNNVITSIIVASRDDKERHCVSLPLYYDQVSAIKHVITRTTTVSQCDLRRIKR